MKLLNPRIKALLYFSVFVGTVLGSYIIYEQKEFIGRNEIIAIVATLVLGIIIAFTIIKIANK